MEPLVLTVDMAGLPQAWVALEEAITYHAKQMVAWSIGGEVREFRGGWQKNGERSRIATKSILAIKGSGALSVDRMLRAPLDRVGAKVGGQQVDEFLELDGSAPLWRE